MAHFVFWRGFTLTGLLIVIAIIGLLAGIVPTNVQKAREKAQVAKAVIEVKEVTKEIANFYGDTGVYPGIVDS